MIVSDFSKVTIYKDSEPVNGVAELEATESSRQVELYEYHNDEPYATVNYKKVYELTLAIYSDSFCEAESGFTLRIVSDAQTITYMGCSISSITVKKEGQFINKVKITAEKRTIE